ncbi:response regulator [Methylosinus sporium]|uniref:Response regulator n=1 Tax=Methylosinus sporium TaxID=428 RepID=A0A549T2A3_METSR|nr:MULTISPECIES: response regulator [Methylosinus]MBU3889944.1 response regulator [Methylosinus sp. KRF6]TRL35995.1 response regulator [Methylosinus sporium]
MSGNEPIRILVVEDEPAIAADLCFVVEEVGYEIGGTASSVDEALKLIEHEEIDGVILDANLRGSSSASVADALRAKKLPFFVLSGYLQRQLPEPLCGAPFLAKPYDQDELTSRILALARQ